MSQPVRNQKAGETLVVHSYSFIKNKRSRHDTRIFWECSKRRTPYKCQARATTDSCKKLIGDVVGRHIHEPDNQVVQKSNALWHIREQSLGTTNAPTVIFNTIVIAPSLPNETNLKRLVRRVRNKH